MVGNVKVAQLHERVGGPLLDEPGALSQRLVFDAAHAWTLAATIYAMPMRSVELKASVVGVPEITLTLTPGAWAFLRPGLSVHVASDTFADGLRQSNIEHVLSSAASDSITLLCKPRSLDHEIAFTLDGPWPNGTRILQILAEAENALPLEIEARVPSADGSDASVCLRIDVP